MRLRYMELPSEVEGDAVRSKFILIIDRIRDVGALPSPDVNRAICDRSGALGCFAFAEDVELDADDPFVPGGLLRSAR